MSFLSDLKAQAHAVQAAQTVAQTQAQMDAEQRVERTEAACKTAWNYLSDLARQLNVLAPDGPNFSVDGKTPWPAMKLIDFRADSRKKTLQDREVFSSIGIGWEIEPQQGKAVLEHISVNFLPELQRVESRLAAGNIPHERRQVRHPEKHSVQAITFEYLTQARGSISITPDHDEAMLSFRFCNVSGLATKVGVWPADLIQMTFLDEVAKLIMSQPSHLLPTPD